MEASTITENQYKWMNIPEGFEFSTIETEDDVEELIAFNAKIHEPDAGVFLERILEKLPGFQRDMNYIIRDSTTGEIVACINAIPSTWTYDGVLLQNLELGFVGTSESYRNMGLINSLYSYFDRILTDGQFDISVIQGIPYIYRKYGYDFIFPLNRNITLPVRNIPDMKIEDSSTLSEIVIRPAEEEDRAAISELLREENQKLLVASSRSEQLWEIQERTKMNVSMPFETMVLERKGKIDGYFRICMKKDQNYEFRVSSAIIDESSFRSYDTTMRALFYFRDEAKKQNEHILELPGNICSSLGIIALDYGGVLSPGWKYQVRIPNMIAFLNKIRPVLARRLKGTMFEDLTREIFINTYQTCYKLPFQNGELNAIEEIGMQKIGSYLDIRLLPKGFARLVLGEFTIEELRKQNVDFIVRGGFKTLLETLFPKRESYIHYYYC